MLLLSMVTTLLLGAGIIWVDLLPLLAIVKEFWYYRVEGRKEIKRWLVAATTGCLEFDNRRK